MSLEEALKICGNQDSFYLKKMVKALSSNVSKYLNRTEDWQRLEAAKIILKTRGKK